jgi:hypothetical protein
MINPLEQLRGKVPKSLFDEFAYCVNGFPQGKVTKGAFIGVIRDVIEELEVRKTLAVVPELRKVKTKSGYAYKINDESSFSLSSEPTESGFVSSYHDLIHDTDVYRAEDPLEQKGRAIKPIFLDTYTDFLLEDPRKSIGADIARKGDDKSVFICQHGGHVVDIQAYFKQDIPDTAGRLLEMINEHRPTEVIIDITGGWGSGVYDLIIKAGIEEITTVTGIHFNQAPRDGRFGEANARAEMFFNLHELLRRGAITLPLHKALIEELSWIKYKYQADSGKLYIQPKDECKRDNKRSPDHADALALCFYMSHAIDIF